MNRFNIEHIVWIMEQTGMIPVFNHPDIEVAKKVLDVAYQGGVRVFEYTNREANALEIFGMLSDYAKQYEDLVLGIGTIFNTEDAQQFYDAGAQFIVSPALIPDLASFSKAKDILWIPGCGTITEIYNAWTLEAQLIKIFPGNVLGSGFASAVKSVLPKVKIMPTGGVMPSYENLNQWFQAGVSCVGMGSKLIKKDFIATNDYKGLFKSIQDTLQIIKTIRD